MSKVTFTNFASTRTTSVLSSLNTTFSITPGTGANFPTCSGGDWFYCVLTDSLTAPTVREVVKVTSRSGDSFSTVVRAQDGTTALNWPSGSYCELRLTKGTMEDLQAQITADLQIANNLSDLSSTVAARANLGLSTMAVQAANSVSISGGAIAGCQITGGTLDLTPIGSISPNTGAFTTVAATGRIAAGWTQVQAYEAAYGAAGTKSLFACADAAGEASQALAQFNNAASASSVNFVKGRGTAAAGSIVQSGDNLGGIYFYGAASGSAIALAASIAAVVDGTPGAVNDMPGRLVFSVSPDGSATAVEALRISSDKSALFAGQVKGGAGTGTGTPVLVGALEVNTTSDGNTGLSTDSPLQTAYSLPANSLSGNDKGVRITHWGTGAANANTKTLTAFFGTTRIIEAASTTANALSWKIVVHVFRTGASTQVYQAELIIYGVGIEAHLVTNGTCAETDSSAISIYAAGTSISTNDLVQKGRLIEFINQ